MTEPKTITAAEWAKKAARKKPGHDEAKLTATIVARLRSEGLFVFHVANESGGLGARRGAQNKRLGVMSGVADLLILDRCPLRPEIRGVALEVKAGNGKLSNSQKEWIDRASDCGWVCAVIRSVDDAVTLLAGLGLMERN